MAVYYKCNPSFRVKLITFLSFSFLLLIIINTFIFTKLSNIIVLISLVSLFIYTFIHSPYKICITNKSIILYCFLYKKVFYYSDINNICRIYGMGGIRRFGSNGVLGYIGVIDSEKLYYTYYNNEHNMIEINYQGKYYIISCTKPDNLINEVKTNLHYL